MGVKAIYDELTFESGMNTFDEILKHMKSSDLFVILLSDSALKSNWVQRELLHAKENLSIEIYPIIIDSKINHTDSRIPEWLKKYNLRIVRSSSKVINLIKKQMREISWKTNELYKKRDLVYKGRHSETQYFEERFDNLDLPTPRVFIAHGLEKIGRKTYLTNTIKRAISKYDDSYKPLNISLDATQSIEDFILLIDDLGYTNKNIERANIFMMKKEEKSKLAKELIIELNNMKDIVIIDDNGSIIKYNGAIVEWFIDIIKQLREEKDDIYLLVASRFSIYLRKYDDLSDYFFTVNIPELSPSERLGLFKAYVEIYSLQDKVSRDNMKSISKLLSGYPEQVKYLVQRIQDLTFAEVLDNSQDIVEYNNEKVYKIVREYEQDENIFEFLLLLSNMDLIDFDMLDTLINENEKEEYYGLIQKFFIEGICVRYGTDQEYFRVNDVIRDYIRRLKYSIADKFQTKITIGLKNYLKNNKYEDSSIGQYFYYIQEALMNGEEIPEKYLVPSHFLRTIARLYDYKKYGDVITIAKRVLKNEEYMDDDLVYEIRYYYCSALVRRGTEKEFFDEVEKIKDRSERFFLKGFYYRLRGKYQDALKMLDIAMEKKKSFSRAKREKVQIYLNVFEYKIAYPLAIENYHKWKDNIFHVHAYFVILLQEEKNDENQKTLSILLSKLESTKDISEKAKEMYFECQALYTAFYLNNKEESLRIINELIRDFPQQIYPLLAKFDILEFYNDAEEMNLVIKNIRNKDRNKNPSIHTSAIVRTIAYLISIGQKKEALHEYNILTKSTGYPFTYIKNKYGF